MNSRYRLLALLLILLTGGLYVLLRPLPHPESAIYFNPPHKLTPFKLAQSDGSALTVESLRGHWSFVFIGYTYCPDICPTTLADLRAVYPALKQQDASSRVLFISVDPVRDDLPRLASYITFFNKEFIAATGPHEELLRLTRELGLVYSMVEHKDAPEHYLIDHSASIVLINPQGEVQAVFRPDAKQGPFPQVSMSALVSDFARIRALYQREQS